MDTFNVPAKSEVHSFNHSWDNSDWSFGWELWTQSWGRGGHRESGMVPFERVLVSSYLYAFQRYWHQPLLCSSTLFFPTPPLVSSKFTHFPLEVGAWPLDYEEQSVGLIAPAISFQDFQPMWSWYSNVTDRRTDDMRSQDCALHYSASRGMNNATNFGFIQSVCQINYAILGRDKCIQMLGWWAPWSRQGLDDCSMLRSDICSKLNANTGNVCGL